MIRSPFRAHPPKPKACKVCRREFLPRRPGQRVCCAACAHAFAVSQRQKSEHRAEVRAKAEARKALREAKQRAKSYPELVHAAQVAWNAYVRVRDADLPCISCDGPLEKDALGGGYDAGHYRSVGAAPHLRFHEDNVHAQCKNCNRWKSGNVVAYRRGLLKRIGEEKVLALEADNTVRKFTREELVEMRAEFIEMRKALVRARAE